MISMRHFGSKSLAIAVTLLLLSSVSKGQTGTGNPGCGLHTHSLQSIYAQAKADKHADLKGIVILCNGKRVSEAYFNGDSAADTLHDIRSATKSITATLMGIAIQQGLVHSVDDSISLYLPGLPHDGKQNIKIRDLLTMRSGLDADEDDPHSPGNEDNLDKSGDWLKAAFPVPVKSRPGQTYVYCSLNAFLTGVIVQNAAHMALDLYAQKNLFEPLGIDRFEWAKAAGGWTKGQGNLSVRARALAAIGQMYLDNGTYRKHKVLDPSWVQSSWSELVPISGKDPYADFYGYMWYFRHEPTGETGTPVHFASGNGGNKIYIVPSRHIVIAITSSAYNTNYGQRRSQNILLSVLSDGLSY